MGHIQVIDLQELSRIFSFTYVLFIMQVYHFAAARTAPGLDLQL